MAWMFPKSESDFIPGAYTINFNLEFSLLIIFQWCYYMVPNYKDNCVAFCPAELELNADVTVAVTWQLAVFCLLPSFLLTFIACKSVSANLLLDFYCMFHLEGWNPCDKTWGIIVSALRGKGEATDLGETCAGMDMPQFLKCVWWLLLNEIDLLIFSVLALNILWNQFVSWNCVSF